MEENSECEKCLTWEEEIYWKFFNSFHFFVPLPHDFHDYLVLPDKFSAHMKDQLPDKVSLKGPSDVSWDIELLKSDDLVFVGSGWKDFVKANGLKENYILMFKYERNSNFNVVIFDQGSCCEKESTYFVKNCTHTYESDQKDQRKRVVSDAPSTDIIEGNDAEEASFIASKKPRKDDEAEVCLGERENASTLVICAASKHGEKSLNGNDEAEASSGAEENAICPRKGVISASLRPRTRRALAIARKRSILSKKVKDGKEVSDILHGDVIILDDEDSYLENDDSHKSEAQSKKCLNDEDVITTELEKRPSRNFTASESHHLIEMNSIPVEDGERFQVIDKSHNLEAQPEKSPGRITPFKELCLTTPDNSQHPQLICYYRRNKDQAKKKTSALGISKMKSLCETDEARPKNQVLPKSSKKPVFKSDKKPSALGISKMKSLCETDEARPKNRVLPKSSKKPVFKSDKKPSAFGISKMKSLCKTDEAKSKNQVLPKSSKKPVFKSASDGKSLQKRFISSRPVTEEQKADALKRANEKQTEDSFTVVMRPASVCTKFFLHIPAKWLCKHPLKGNQKVVLRIGEKTWLTTFCSYSQCRGLSPTGWRTFARENLLEQFDVLVFTPVNQNSEAVVLDVDIFRVVETIVPPLPKNTTGLRML